MRKDFGKKTWLYPMPVFIVGSYDAEGNADAMNAAWGGIYDDDQVMLCLDSHKTTDNIVEQGAFTVCIADAANVVASDYVGIVSANDDPDKMKKSGFHTTKSAHVNVPIIDELPMAIECRLLKVNEDGRIIGEIVNVSVDERVLDENGNIDPAKVDPIIFDPVNASYLKVSEKVGNAFADGLELK